MPAFDDQTGSTTTAPLDVPTALPDPCAAYSTWNATYRDNLIGIPLQAYGTAAVCTGVVTDKLAATDMLVVRHLDTCAVGETGCAAEVADKLYMQVARCSTENRELRHGPLWHRHFRPHHAQLHDPRREAEIFSHIYYVRDYAVTAVDGIPTLMRSEFDSTAVGSAPAHQAAVPLVEGIDGFRVEFGIDSLSRTGAAVNYANPIVWDDPDTKTTSSNRGDRCRTAPMCTAIHAPPAQLMNATSAKIYVLARSREPTQGYVDTKTYTLGSGTALGPYNDSFKRHVYTTTIRLPNVAGRRERP